MNDRLRKAPQRWLLWLIPPLLICILWQSGGATRVDIGAPIDVDVIQGFHEPEQGPHGTHRWSRPEAQLRLPSRDMPGVLTIRGTTAPDGTLVTLDFGPGARVILPPISADDLGLRRYRLLWPAQPQQGSLGWGGLSIQARVPEQTAEKRALGLAIESLTLSALARPLMVPPLLILLLLTLIPPLLAQLLRIAGLERGPSQALALAIGITIVVIWSWQPLWLQRYLLRWLGTLAALTALAWWARRLVAHGTRTTAQRILLVLVAFGALIPFYFVERYAFDYGHYRNALLTLSLLAALAFPFAGRQMRWLLAGAMVIGILGYAGISYYHVFSRDYADDFKALFRGPRSFLSGDPLYNLEQLQLNHLAATYKYPPFFVLIMGPLTGIAFSPAIQLWRAINLLLLLISAVLLWRWSKQPLRSWSSLGLLYLLLVFQPLTDTLRYGQVDMILLVGFAAALLMLGRGRWTWWGALLALPTAVKVYPAYLLIHGVALRRWRSLAAFVLALAALLSLAILILGLDVHLIYAREVLTSIGGGTSWVENQTINGFLNRFTTPKVVSFEPDRSALIQALTYIGAAALSLAALIFARRMTPDAGFGLWIVTLLIILPAAWIHYQAILLIPLYQLLVRVERRPGRLSWPSLFLYGLSWALLAAGNQWTFFDRTLHGPVWALILSYKLYGLSLLWLALVLDPTARSAEVEQRAPAEVRQELALQGRA